MLIYKMPGSEVSSGAEVCHWGWQKMQCEKKLYTIYDKNRTK